MFGYKKERGDSDPIKSVYSNQDKIKTDIDIDKLVVHTMKSDLDELAIKTPFKKNPPVPKKIIEEKKPEKKDSFKAKIEKTPEAPRAEKVFTPKIETATKIETADKIAAAEAPNKKEEVVPERKSGNSIAYSPENNFKKMYEKKKALEDFSSEEIGIEENKGPLGKIVSFIVFLCILAAIGWGGYYFWETRIANMSSSNPNNINQPNEVQSTDKNQPSEVQTIDKNQTSSVFSLTNANYLKINLTDLSDKVFIEKMSDAASQVKSMDTSGPVEFILTDNSNNPLSFSDFSQKIGLGLPQTILSQLGDSFSIYVYLENGEAKLGLSVSARNSAILKTAMDNEENSLAKDLRPLFMGNSYTLENTYNFKSSTYNGNSIRYANIISPTELSVDYTISPKQLLIGTTKKTLRSILDRLSSSPVSATPTAQNM